MAGRGREFTTQALCPAGGSQGRLQDIDVRTVEVQARESVPDSPLPMIPASGAVHGTIRSSEEFGGGGGAAALPNRDGPGEALTGADGGVQATMGRRRPG